MPVEGSGEQMKERGVGNRFQKGNKAAKKPHRTGQKELREAMQELARDGEFVARLTEVIKKHALKGNTYFVNMLLDRVYGKPRQEIVTNAKDTDTIVVNFACETDERKEESDGSTTC